MNIKQLLVTSASLVCSIWVCAISTSYGTINLGAFTTPAASSAPDGYFTPGMVCYDWSNSHIQINYNTLADCAAGCTNMQDCFHFTFNTIYGLELKCRYYLQKSCPDIAMQPQNHDILGTGTGDGWYQYSKISKVMPQSSVPSGYKISPIVCNGGGYDSPDPSIDEAGSHTIEACAIECAKDPGCYHIRFDTAVPGFCWFRTRFCPDDKIVPQGSDNTYQYTRTDL